MTIIMTALLLAFAGCDRTDPFKDAPFIPTGPANIQVTMNGTVLPNGELLTIPDTAIGTQRTATIRIRNLGSEDLEISDVSIVGDREGVFSLNQSGMEYILAAGMRTSFTTTFTPVLPGTYNITVTISNNDADPEDSAYTIPLAATAVVNPEPEINIQQGLTPVSSDGTWVYPIGDVDNGATVSVPFTVYNTGTADLDISVSLSGTGGGMFTINTTDMDTTVAGGSFTGFSVVFHPTAVGDFTATVTVSSNDADEGDYIFTVTGSGVQNEISVTINGADVADGTSYDMGGLLVNSGSLNATVRISNTGTADLYISSVTLSGTGFSISPTFVPTTLSSGGEYTTYMVTFTPTVVGPATASIIIQSDDLDEGEYNIMVNAESTAPEINVAWQTTDIPSPSGIFTFQNAIANSGSVTETFIIQNLGGYPLTITSVSCSDETNFSLDTGTMSTTVPAYGETSFNVTFKPKAMTPLNATITIQNNDFDSYESPYTFGIAGTGVNAQFYVKATTGTDVGNTEGTEANPFRSITYAETIATTNAIITVLPGIYDQANGETFPITLKAGQSLIGDPAHQGQSTLGGASLNTVIRGNVSNIPVVVWPPTSTQGTIVVLGNDTQIEGFIIQNENSGIDNLFGVYSSGGAFNASSNTFDATLYGGIYASGADIVSRDNSFNTTSYGYYVLAGSSDVRIYNNSISNASIPIEVSGGPSTIISGNKIGGSGQVGIQGSGSLVILRNLFTLPGSYIYGAILSQSGSPEIRRNIFESLNGVQIESGSTPDLGTDPKRGNNDFSQCIDYAIQVTGTDAVGIYDIYAVGNKWYGGNPIGNIEVLIQGPRVWYGKGSTDYVTAP